MMKEWLENNPKGLTIDDSHVNTLLFVDDQVVFAEKENDLQKAMFELQKVAEKYDIKI